MIEAIEASNVLAGAPEEKGPDNSFTLLTQSGALTFQSVDDQEFREWHQITKCMWDEFEKYREFSTSLVTKLDLEKTSE
jgi:hypothetical protein